ncbi:MAG: zinc ABC transporter substrate-binding protein [Truepera sp.]|nr:zinc ABC transporter substrate-binding protein [Truepera sp.]
MKALLCWLTLVGLSLSLAQPNVVVSIFPYFDLTRQVAGEHATVTLLLPPGVSPHTFDPTPRDVRRIAEADLVIMNGGDGIDGWLRRLFEASGSRAPILDVFAALNFRERVADLYGPEFYSQFINSHLWLDARLMAELPPLIAAALAEIDPGQADVYHANAERLSAELLALDAELQTMLAPISGAAFVPFHDAWPYFAIRYGLNLVVEIEPFPGREPTPAYLQYALGLIEKSGAKAVFSERQLNPRPAEVVAEQAGVALYVMDPVGGQPDTASYQSMMRFNASVLLAALAD